MNKLKVKSLRCFALLSVLCVALLSGCGGQTASSDFDEADVTAAAEQVIQLINDQDSDALKELCTVQMKEGLTDAVLQQVYASIGEGGAFEAVEQISIGNKTDKSSEEEFAVAVAKANYEIKNFTYTITFTKQMKLAGLYYK